MPAALRPFALRRLSLRPVVLHRLALPLAVALSLPLASASAQTAFRFSTLALRDPHTYVVLSILGCQDITDSVPFGLGTPLNGMIQDAIETDSDGDGSLDLNALIYFVPQDVAVGTATFGNGTQWNPDDQDGELIFLFGSCTPPYTSPVCVPGDVSAIRRLAYANDPAAPCLDAIPGTLTPSYPSPTFPDTPCFVTEPFDVTLSVGGIPVPLTAVQLGATYQGTMPPRLVNGLVRGFLREATADSVIIPASVALVGGQPLSSLLPGGTGCCAGHDDRDVEGGETGWWMYLDFEADEVPFSPVTAAPEEMVPASSVAASLVLAPNPFTSRVELDVTGAAPTARLDVYDVRGRRVRALGPVGRSGRRSVTWDGTDARGRPLAGGVYFVRLEGTERAVTRKLVRAN